jgi:N-methylhydantoinase A
MIDEMDHEASALVTGAGVDANVVTRRLSAMMRYVGQGYEIETPLLPEFLSDDDRSRFLAAFTAAYTRRYGRSEDLPVEILSWRLSVEGPRSSLGETLVGRKIDKTAGDQPTGRRQAWFGDRFIEVPVYRRAGLQPGIRIAGAAIIEETESTTIVPPDFNLRVDPVLNLVLTRAPS